MRSHLKVYFSFEEETKELNDAEKGSLLLAMLRYAKTGENPALTGNERFLFPVFKSVIDRDVETYNIKVSNGSKGGRPVSNNNQSETENNLNKPNETENNQGESEKTETAKTKNKNKDIRIKNIDILFTRFWDSYPRKEAKPRARKEFESLKPDETLLQMMLTAIEKWKASAQWREDNGQYIPHPATWLHNKRWEDEPPKSVMKTVPMAQYSQREYHDEESMDDVMERLMAR